MEMKKLLPRMACALLATAAFATTAGANGLYQGYIYELSAGIDGRYVATIQFTGAIQAGAPACANGSIYLMGSSGAIANMIIVDPASTAGKLQIDLLRDALTSQKLIRVVGNNTCTKVLGLEDINAVIRYAL